MAWSIESRKCIRCGGCVSVCPFGALELKEQILHDGSLCTNCGICQNVCPVKAIKVEK